MRQLLLFIVLLTSLNSSNLLAAKIVYWPLEDTEKLYRPQLKVAKDIVWQQLKSIDGVKKHKLIKKDRKRLKACGAKIKCIKKWLNQRGVFGLFFIKMIPTDEGVRLSMRFVDEQSEDRLMMQHIQWQDDLNTLNYEIEVMARRWIRPQSLKGTLKLSGLTADAKLWLDGVEVTDGLMQEAWSRQLQAGIHTVRVERNAFVPYAKNIEIHHRKVSEVEVFWNADPLYEVEQEVSRFNTRRTEVLIGTGVAGVAVLTWAGAAINTLIVGADMEKRANAQMLHGEIHETLVSEGTTSALIANISLGAFMAAVGWNLYWGFQPLEEES